MIFLLIQNKTASACYRILVVTYGDLTPTVKICERCFNRFKKGDFDVIETERENQSRKFEDDESLLDKDDTQTQKMMAE